ncbi:MAG: SDR family oxidoreductase, partial [Acidimicrobiia bacterium]|nr:SDR family oxidoreductase [Acidimicrobiia bacterium]
MVKRDQVVLITGGSRGFGRSAARELAYRGHRVVATMRQPDRDGPGTVESYEDRISVTECDVTDRDSVAAAVGFCVERHGRIDALYNNAGYGLYGPVEDLLDEEIHRQMDTNFVGQIRMAQAVLPTMREQASGVIINVSSVAGKIVGPLMGLYAASKFAVEAMSEALRYEVRRWGVQVTILEPGMYESDWQTSSLDVTKNVRDGTSVYQDSVDAALKTFRERGLTRPGARTIGVTVADIVELEQPLPMRWPVGEDTLSAL